ncbi:MAG TPA: hypothetical protein VFW40_12320 [Capsulimonadaceae bacterium]|nr:hypothetical protein [Capsulimonadaceae bacterium]
MKRIVLGLLLIVVAVAAVLLFGRLGLFHRPGRASGMQGPPMGGSVPGFPSGMGSQMLSGIPPGMHSTTVLYSNDRGVPVISSAQLAEVLKEWTFPGASLNPVGSSPPGSSQPATASKNTKSLVSYAPPADIWRFYQTLAGSLPATGGPASNTPGFFPQKNGDMSSGMTSSVAGINMGHYSRATKDYVVSAILFYQNGSPHTQITLQVSPRTRPQKMTVLLPGASGGLPPFPKSVARLDRKIRKP